VLGPPFSTRATGFVARVVFFGYSKQMVRARCSSGLCLLPARTRHDVVRDQSDVGADQAQDQWVLGRSGEDGRQRREAGQETRPSADVKPDKVEVKPDKPEVKTDKPEVKPDKPESNRTSRGQAGQVEVKPTSQTSRTRSARDRQHRRHKPEKPIDNGKPAARPPTRSRCDQPRGATQSGQTVDRGRGDQAVARANWDRDVGEGRDESRLS